MAGLAQKTAEFELFANHFYVNIRYEVELAIINIFNYHKIKRLKQRLKPSISQETEFTSLQLIAKNIS